MEFVPRHLHAGISAQANLDIKERTMRGGISLGVVLVLSVAIAILGLAGGPANAAARYWDGGTTDIVTNGDGASDGGAGTWDTTILNWDQGAEPHAAWVNANNDTAVFGGAAGTVTLAEPISVGGLQFSAAGYTITGDTLNFAAANTITAGATATIESGITGSPAVSIAGGALTFAPTSAGVTLDTVSMQSATTITLGGTTTGNSLAYIPKVNQNTTVNKDGTGTWTVGGAGFLETVYGGNININAGELIANGTLWTTYGHITLNSGATLHYNTAKAIKPRSGAGNEWRINGGALDNTSGAAITASTYNPAMQWNGDFSFIGSNGSAGDLYLGIGGVTLTGTRTVTVQNAATTLTVGSVITGTGHGLTKAGDGTLLLTGDNTYTGDTTVEGGTLSITKAYLDDASDVFVSAGGLLNLNFTGADMIHEFTTGGTILPGGIWGAPYSDAPFTSPYLTGAGWLKVLSGTRCWDGGTTYIGSDGDGLSDGNSGTWSTVISNWDQGPGAAHTPWNNAKSDTAIFGGAAGTVTLAEDITVGGLIFKDVDLYTIDGDGSYSLNFGGGANMIAIDKDTIITAGITGSPTVDVTNIARRQTDVTLAPTGSVTMTLGTIACHRNQYQHAGNVVVRLSGTSVGNTVSEITCPPGPVNELVFYKQGSGTWTLGNLDMAAVGGNAQIYIEGAGGRLIVTGTLNSNNRDVIVRNNGTLGGTGTVAKIGLKLDVQNRGTVAPGDGIGTLTSAGGAWMQDGSKYEWQFGQPGSTDILHVRDGTLDLDNFILKILDANGYAASSSDALPVFTYNVDTVTVDMDGFDNDDANNFDVTALDGVDADGVMIARHPLADRRPRRHHLPDRPVRRQVGCYPW